MRNGLRLLRLKLKAIGTRGRPYNLGKANKIVFFLYQSNESANRDAIESLPL